MIDNGVKYLFLDKRVHKSFCRLVANAASVGRLILRSIGLENGPRVHYVVEKPEISLICGKNPAHAEIMEKSKGGVNFRKRSPHLFA